MAALYEYGILTFGSVRAKSYMQGLYERFCLLAERPELGRRSEELAPNLHRVLYGAHVIFYQPEPNQVLVVRVLRKEMDFKQHL